MKSVGALCQWRSSERCVFKFRGKDLFFKTKSILTSLFDMYVLNERVQLSLCFLGRLRCGFFFKLLSQEIIWRRVLAKCSAKWPINKIQKGEKINKQSNSVNMRSNMSPGLFNKYFRLLHFLISTFKFFFLFLNSWYYFLHENTDLKFYIYYISGLSKLSKIKVKVIH